MCGIAGFYGFRNDKLIKEISKQLKHRGPDSEGFFISDEVSLSNRRLAIIDTIGGNQPIFNEDKSIVVVYNGEIYNYQELRNELRSLGHIFSTKSDTEIIVHGYEQWGEKYFDKLNGMFAAALWDEKKRKLILFRDHFGIKPLYYAYITEKVNQGLIFCSEIKPIFESGYIKKKPNDRIIYRYLKFRIHDDQPETFFEGINKLLPGEMMVIEGGKFHIQSYSTLKDNLLRSKKIKDFGKKEIAGFKKKLIEAIRLRLVSEVPVGSCLSGGLDSSAIVSIIDKLLKEKIKESFSIGKIQKVFSAVFPRETNNEEKYINEVLKTMKLEGHKVKPKPEEFFKEIKEFIRTQEEPTISTGPYAQYKVMEKAKKHVTVLLDGQGADEMMAGYLPYYFVYFRQLLKQKKYFTLLKEIAFSLDIILNIIVKTLIRPSIRIENLLRDSFLNKYSKEKLKIIKDNLKERLIEDIFKNSLPALLRYEDRNSMHFSIEGRVPFLDFNLLKYLFSLPDNAIINLGWNKNILRQSIKDILPELITKRRNKIGFTTPEFQWFMRLKNKIYQVFMSQSFAKRPYFNQKEVLKTFQLFIEGKFDDTMVFWRLLNLELWLEIFFDKHVHKLHRSDKVIKFGEPNEGKKILIKVNGKKYQRFPIKTALFRKKDNYIKKIADYVIKNAIQKKRNIFLLKKWFVVVSEKIIAISQGRSYFLWEIKPCFFAKILSKFVTKTPYGIGLGSPWTMQLAIQEVGLFRILLAALLSAITKTFGLKGIFYRVAGKTIASIDGPTEYSLYPSNVSAKLGPKDPQKVVENIKLQIINDRSNLNFNFPIENFLGVVIIDANDLGVTVLGNSTNISNATIEEIFRDNPMGQTDEQTPLVIVVEK